MFRHCRTLVKVRSRVQRVHGDIIALVIKVFRQSNWEVLGYAQMSVFSVALRSSAAVDFFRHLDQRLWS